MRALELKTAEEVRPWLGRLVELGIVHTRGRTKGMEYFVQPEVLRKLEFKGKTTLKGIEGHRLRELILRDLERYQQAAIGEIHARIGVEIPRRKVLYELQKLVAEQEIGRAGERQHTVYLWTK